MKKFIVNDFKYSRLELILINLIIQFYLFRTTVPSFKLPFLILYSFFTVYVIVKYKQRLINDIRNFASSFFQIILIFIIFCLAFVFSDKIFLSIFKDIFNAIILISIFFLLSVIVHDKERLKFLINNFINIVILFALIIATISLIKLFNIYETPVGEAQIIDTNFALLPIFFGMIGIFYNSINNNSSKYEKIVYIVLLTFFSINIFFSGSRRGIIMLGAFIVAIIMSQLLFLIKKHKILKRISSFSKYYLFSLIIVSIIGYFFVFQTSCWCKNRSLESIGSKNIFKTKHNITAIMAGYTYMIQKKVDVPELYKNIWIRDFDSRDPDCGWGFRNSERVYPLTRDLLGIVPKDAIGCQLDSSSFRKVNRSNQYILIDTLNVKQDEIYRASIFCNISEEFDGRSISLGIGRNALRNNTVTNKPIKRYDLRNKGEWQVLEIEFGCNDGEVPIYLIVSTDNDSLSKISGNITYAYPQFERINNRNLKLYEQLYSTDPDVGWGFKNSKSIFPLTGKNVEIVPSEAIGCLIDSTTFKSYKRVVKKQRLNLVEVNSNEEYKAEVFCFVSKNFDGRLVRLGIGKKAIVKKTVYNTTTDLYDLRKKGQWQKLEIKFNCNKGTVPINIEVRNQINKNLSKFNGYVIFAYPRFIKQVPADLKITQNAGIIDLFKPNKKVFGLILNDIDPIRELTSKLISEDTTYHAYRSNLFVDTISGKFSGPRIARWRFAWQIYSKEYNLRQKIIGSGFNYLNWYGFYFYRDKTKSDWPHNPFLSVLLYSGILGLILYIVVLSRAIMLYIRYRRQYYILFIFFLITFFFAFFSVNSPFTPPIWGFFLMLPYFIHSVHRRSESKTQE